MKSFEWNEEKNQWLKDTRGISFEEVEEVINAGNLLEVVDNPNKGRYPNQKMAAVKIRNYVYIVPFVDKRDNVWFLKTIYPSRKATREYLRKGVEYEKKK